MSRRASPDPGARTTGETFAYIFRAIFLKRHFARAGRQDAYVSANSFLYYEQGNPRAVVAPDVYVVLGAPGHPRDTYLLWNEPKGPDFVLEVTSASTRREDERRKRDVYASLGVSEYFLYDPRGEYLTPPLQGYRLRDGAYRPLPAVTVLPGRGVAVPSEVLRLEFREVGEARRLRLHDPATGQHLLTYEEFGRVRDKEAAARRAAEARVSELESRLRELEKGAALSEAPLPGKPVR